jgi:hypothetical protein
MNLHADLELDGTCSPALLAQLPRYQTILHTWFPALRIARIQCRETAPAPAAPGDATASFFSGGVDAFHTALRNRDRVNALILMHGLDFALDRRDLRAAISASLQRAARRMDLPLIEMETNSRELTEPHASWPYHQFGPALIGPAHLLTSRYHRVLVPSSETYAHLDPLGSHPLTDPLLGSDRLIVEHDGDDCTRSDKVRFLANHPVALEHLRVCWRNPGDAYNCGVCEKCVRTQLNLLATGALDRCPAFPEPLTAARVAAVEIPADIVLHHVVDNLAALRAAAAPADIIDALSAVIDRYRQQQLAAQLATLPHLNPNLPALRAALYAHDQNILGILAGRGHRHLLKLWVNLLRAGLDRRLGARR